MTRVERNMQRRLQEGFPGDRENSTGSAFGNGSFANAKTPGNDGAKFAERKLKALLTELEVTTFAKHLGMFVNDRSYTLMGTKLDIYAVTQAEDSMVKAVPTSLQSKVITGVYIGQDQSMNGRELDKHDQYSNWNPQIVKFLKSCGFEEYQLSSSELGYGLPDNFPLRDKNVFGINFFVSPNNGKLGSGDVSQINKACVALQKFAARAKLANDSYAHSRQLGREDWEIEKGYRPDKHVAFEWQSGTATITYRYDQVSGRLTCDPDWRDNFTSAVKLGKVDVSGIFDSIDTDIDFISLLDDADTSDLDNMVADTFGMEIEDVTSSDQIEYLRSKFEDMMNERGYHDIIEDFEGLKAACECIKALLEEFSLVDARPAIGNITRPVNKKRAKRLANNPSMKAVGESKRRNVREEYRADATDEAYRAIYRLLDFYWDQQDDEDADLNNAQLCDKVVIGVMKALEKYEPDFNVYFNREQIELILSNPDFRTDF